MSLHYRVKYSIATASTEKSVTAVDETLLIQSGQPRSYCSTRHIAQFGVILVIFHRDLGLKCLKRRLLTSEDVDRVPT